jgi:signal transduction histidine kinase
MTMPPVSTSLPPAGRSERSGLAKGRGALSLRHKLLGVIMVTALAALVVALGAMVAYDLRVSRSNWVADVTTQAELLGATIAPAISFDDQRVARENLQLLRLRPRIRAAAVYNARGGLFATYVQQGVESRFPPLPGADGAHSEGQDVVVFRRIVANGEILGTVYLRGDYEFADQVWSYLGIAFTLALAAMLVAFLMSSWLQKIVTRPILSIAAIARDVVQRRDYSRRAEKLSDDEVGLLVESFNGMLGEIERRSREMESANLQLGAEVAERRRSQEEVARLNVGLEDRVRERTAQLQMANNELEAFCYSVSHDLRAPLRGIDGFATALREDFAAQLPAEANRYLDIIQSSAQRMGQLIEDLLDLSRVSRNSMETAEVDLSETARQVVRDLRHREPAREVDISIWDGMHPQGDPRLIKAALENLIGNAWKFTSRTGQARIEVGALVGQGAAAGATYFVRDNGAGFDMAFANKLFHAFQRLHGEDEFPGTGIGLATVQRMVTRHGGRIWTDSKPGKGTVFYFTLVPGVDEGPESDVRLA